MGISTLVHVLVGIILGVIRWVRSQANVHTREEAVARREHMVAARTQELVELEAAERNLANQRWGGLVPDPVD